jgi:hypothetical protein
MEAFKPVQTPAMKKFLFNPFLHVAIIFGLAFATISYIRQRQKEELRARVEYLKGGPVLVERGQQPDPNAPAGSPTDPSAAPAEDSVSLAETAPPPAATGDQPQAAASPAPGASPEAATTRAALAPAAKTAPNRAVVIFAEIDRRVLNTWINEIRTSGQLRNFDQVAMGPLPQISQKIKNSGVKILQQLELSLQNQPTPYEWFAGTHRGVDPDTEMGFYSSLVVTDSKDGLIHGEIEVQRAFRDPADPGKAMERVSFGGAFEMPMGSGFVMRGLLPSKYGADLGDENNSDPFMSVLKSRAFRNEETEFTLILDFDTSGPKN